MQKHLAVALVTALSVGVFVARPAHAEHDVPFETSDQGPVAHALGQPASRAQLNQVVPGPNGGTLTTSVVNAAVQAMNATASAEIAIADRASGSGGDGGASGSSPLPGGLPVIDGPGSPDAAPQPANPTPTPTTNPGAAPAGPVIQTGIATWYGPGFVGNVTYCGDIYDQWAMTAASNTLPCGTAIIVTNQNTGASVQLRVTDRGGFGGSVILDLSQGAFDVLGGPPAGTIPVSVALAQ